MYVRSAGQMKAKHATTQSASAALRHTVSTIAREALLLGTVYLVQGAVARFVRYVGVSGVTRRRARGIDERVVPPRGAGPPRHDAEVREAVFSFFPRRRASVRQSERLSETNNVLFERRRGSNNNLFGDKGEGRETRGKAGGYWDIRS